MNQQHEKPAIYLQALYEMLEENFQLTGRLTPLPGEYDLNFRLDTPDHRSVVVKVMHPTRDEAWVDLQCQLLAYIIEQDCGVYVPKIFKTVDDRFTISLPTDDGQTALVWVLEFIPGDLLANTAPHSSELLHHFGRYLAAIDSALNGFSHPAAHREIKWDLKQGGWIEEQLHHIEDPAQLELVKRQWGRVARETMPYLNELPHTVVHNDANDHNVLTKSPLDRPQEIAGIIDFGDAIYTVTIADLAIGAAYAIFNKKDPLQALVEITRGYHAVRPLSEQEVAHLYNLVCLRLCVTVVNSAIQKKHRPEDPYVVISERPAWEALTQLDTHLPRQAHYRLRAACGYPAFPGETALTAWLRKNRGQFAPILDLDLSSSPLSVLDLSVSSLLLGANPANGRVDQLSNLIEQQINRDNSAAAIGRYSEPRLLYTESFFRTGKRHTDEGRTIHLGIDLWVQPGEPVYAPIDGTVFEVAENTAPLDYGPLVILQHALPDGSPFFTLYGHLGRETENLIAPGQIIKAGEQIGVIGAPPINGSWPPHLHFQIIGDLLGLGRDFPGVALASQRPLWLSLSPDPNLILDIPDASFPDPPLEREETAALRRRLLGRNLSLSYQNPLKIVRGWRQYLYDESGRAFLDVYNNVPHVGHSHPKVVAAIQNQVGLLNTNTRYLHDNIVRYAAALTDLLPDPLEVCFFVNSASEANELALRLARNYTGQKEMIVLEAAYHGHTTSLIDISPYKFAGPGGSGQRPWVHVAPLADDYRGEYKRDDPEAGVKYGRNVGQIIDEITQAGRQLCGFIAESLPSVGGQIVFPPGYLAEAYRHVRHAGGVCIADEVQTGFGRTGTHMWGFEMQGVVPDIVVLGKPIGNGHPLAAVITTAEVAGAFANGMEFFSTFGGNPVSCAAGLAVLDVLAEENLQENARRVGDYLLEGLRSLIGQHPLVGDARGAGLFLGLELVTDHQNLTPAAAEAAYLVNRLATCGILAGTDGPHHNVLKIRPPMVFSRENGQFLLETLSNLLKDTALIPK